MALDASHSDETLSAPSQRRRLLAQDCLGLTVLWHPDGDLIGAQTPIVVKPDVLFSLSRSGPLFRVSGANASVPTAMPLAHRSLSRQAIQMAVTDDQSIRIEVPDSRMRVRVDGQIVVTSLQLPAERIHQGVVLELGERIVLCLGRIPALHDLHANLGLIGVGAAMTRLRAQVRQVAGTDLPVLLLGESGSGKELIAEAVHQLSPRHAHAMVKVNMAALTSELAAAELFGAVKGAYTGATQGRRGLFSEAHGGTLFMDEIGDTPSSVQPMLLRALESGEYRMLGSVRTENAKVRIIAATDRALADGSFNVPLLRRLEAFVIRVPPLRARREDIGVLVHHLLRSADVVEPSLFDASDLAALARFDWPGNVRQLSHVVRRLILARRHQSPISVSALIDELVCSQPATAEDHEAANPHRDAKSVKPELPKRSYRDPSTVRDAELLDSLACCSWCVRDAASRLGVSRTSFYALLERSHLIRKPRMIPEQEIAAVISAFPNAPAIWAAELKTPREALQRYLREQRGAAPIEPAGERIGGEVKSGASDGDALD